MTTDIGGKRIAILATNGFEQSELTDPKQRLSDAGATVHVISPESGSIRGWSGGDWGDAVEIDKALDEAKVEDYDALVLPGGQINPDILRVNDKAMRLVQGFYHAKKPIAAICHAPWLLIEAGIMKGRKATSYHSIRTDMENAGAHWLDESVVVDEGIITSRKPDDLEAFSNAIADAVAKGVHDERKVA